MRWAAVALLGLSTLWFVALVVAAVDALSAILHGQWQGPDRPYVVMAYGCAAVVLGGCSVALLRPLARPARPGHGAPRWARPLAFSCAGVLAIAAVAALGRPEMFFVGFPGLAFFLAGAALGRRGPAAQSPSGPPPPPHHRRPTAPRPRS